MPALDLLDLDLLVDKVLPACLTLAEGLHFAIYIYLRIKIL